MNEEQGRNAPVECCRSLPRPALGAVIMSRKISLSVLVMRDARLNSEEEEEGPFSCDRDPVKTVWRMSGSIEYLKYLGDCRFFEGVQ